MREHHLTVSRRARYYTLGEPATARHVWIACHGYGQLAQKFLTYLATLDNGQRLLVAPEALSRFYHEQGRGPVGASWMTREDREQEIHDYVAYLDQLASTIQSELRSPATFYGLGFSQGVATLSRWLTGGTTCMGGAAFWAGTIPADLDDARLGERLRGLPVALAAGSTDEFLPKSWLSQEQARLERLGVSCLTFPFHGGHRLDRTVLAQVFSTLEMPSANK
ncbi:MAG: phospholipase [Gemmatimonadota bacterium]